MPVFYDFCNSLLFYSYNNESLQIVRLYSIFRPFVYVFLIIHYGTSVNINVFVLCVILQPVKSCSSLHSSVVYCKVKNVPRIVSWKLITKKRLSVFYYFFLTGQIKIKVEKIWFNFKLKLVIFFLNKQYIIYYNI